MTKHLVIWFVALCTTLGCEQQARPERGATSAKASPKPDSADPAAAASSVLEQVRDAASAAAKKLGPVEGGSACEKAFAELRALVEAAGAIPDSQDKRDEDVPKRQDFLKSCNALPPDVQLCMQLSHALQHAAECKTKIDALPDDVKVLAKTLMKNK